MDDMGVNVLCNIYRRADVVETDGEPLEAEAELNRKRNVLQAMKERILDKKPPIFIKTIEMIKNTPTPDSKGATLRERVTRILQQHPHSFRSKGETNWSPTQRNYSTSNSNELPEEHHPLKLRVKAVMRHRIYDTRGGFTSNSQVSDHEMATRPVTPSPPCQKISSQILEDSVANKGFERFLSLLNKGVDMDLLSRIVNDDSEDPHLGNQPFNSQPSGVREDSDPSTLSKTFQFNSGPQLSENSGDNTELSTREQSPRQTNSLSDDGKNGKDSLSSTSKSKSPSIMEKTLKEEREMSKVNEQHEQLQNILNTLGLRLEVDDLSKITDRTHERLYGKKNERMPVAASKIEQETSETTRSFCKTDRTSALSFSSSRSCSQSPSYRQDSHNRESLNCQKEESFSVRCVSRKTREELSSLHATQDDIQARTIVGKNKVADTDEIHYMHSHRNPTLSACPDYTSPHYSQYDTNYSSGTSCFWTSAVGLCTTPHNPNSSSYSMDTNHSHHAILPVKQDGDVFFVNPDLSRSEGQFGSTSGSSNLQVVNMKHPLGHCLPQMTFDMSLNKEQPDQEKTKQLKLLKKRDQDEQILGSHWDKIPFVEKQTTQSVKVEPSHGQRYFKEKTNANRGGTSDKLEKKGFFFPSYLSDLHPHHYCSVPQLEDFNKMSKTHTFSQIRVLTLRCDI
ncbi:uncharacterized protein LOC133506457 isoform X2 [Syngnathoides biaculeatus]|uniref:uncharacterized protein LOC133506457 isoform X2 n=1 Tax=Syngnathoides biaculeatus TaxID=300417 RepID=UPI002ADE80E5|nr:uncharacterized protein LOC133506457 isoform X2 [Syngnathoides biaculeatus]